ncbi:SPI-7-type island replicative DNA helicase [Escherichia coli]|uniref:SPI-7-type island replicative DNA helicase n=1 Tax=Escherichia coli TaxID=562 RepID=UPI0005E5E269|nr:SPI-7-type island replicative DNA helicase [Escherichia coli]EKY0336420.1 replicative DNA helicase [Escherichia coli O2:H6]CGT98630.1 replicative DNA helicase [Salmonella enterica subsp. enterica serovar Typhi]HBR7498058.1 replicative DNA helicase [Klebsiella pneumoniae]EFI6281382.1 replicative DNA helicase [Escherichia coli]EIR8515854.1 replicative DNA helicase [Escherichia coli]
MAEMLIPHSVDAEQAVLGGLMLDNERWDEVILQISPEDLFSRQHRMVFRVMAELAGEGLPLDLITITERLENRGELEQCGGFAYLAEMSKNTPSAANILAYAGVVAEKSRLRQLMAVGNSLLSDVQAPKVSSADILESAEGKLFNIAEQGAMQFNSETGVNEALDKLLTQLESISASGGLPGTPTGFSELDAMTCGLQPGDLALLAARPSMGKTSLAMAACTAAIGAKPDDHVFVFSLEMPSEQLMMRLLAMEGRVELSRLRSGNMDDEDWARVSAATGRIIEWKNRLIIDDTSYQTPATLRARARRYVRKYGRPSLIMLDYLQLVRSPGQENRTQEIADISRSLKALGKELGCPVLALSQLNRLVEQRADKRPNNGDLRESGALEQDADLIMFIYRDEVYNPGTPDAGVAEIIVGKQRQGPTGTVKVKFDGRYTLFSEFQEGSYDFGYCSGRKQA